MKDCGIYDENVRKKVRQRVCVLCCEHGHLHQDQAPSDGVVTKDIGERGGHSPPATASSCEKGGSAFGDTKLSPVCGGGSGG